MRNPLAHHPHTRRGATLATLFVALGLVAACGSAKDASAGRAQSPTSSAQGPAVAIDTFMFTPKLLHLHRGDTATWTNKDSILHTVTSGTREYDPSDSGHVTATHKNGMFDMQLDGRGATAHFRFTQPGTFHYFCNRHPGMEAGVEVS